MKHHGVIELKNNFIIIYIYIFLFLIFCYISPFYFCHPMSADIGFSPRKPYIAQVVKKMDVGMISVAF